MSSSSTLQTSGILSKEQLIHLFNRFAFLTSQPDVKKRISDAVKDKQEAVAMTTAIQEEILLEMGIDPRFGIGCLGKVNTIYENDQDLMIRFYGFVAKEEMACDEAELEPDEFAEKMHSQQKLQEKQLEMLNHMRRFHPDDQSAILETLHQQLEEANFDNSAAVLTSEQIQEIVRRRVTPFTKAAR
ncbi:plant/protein [Tasmannia lanceolata]|uniref:plant/protein n=1 Tax=Tasmannia lanceolata TaxID=3420 RepID=UPI004062C67E